MSVGPTIEFTVKADATEVLKKCQKETLDFHAVMLISAL